MPPPPRPPRPDPGNKPIRPRPGRRNPRQRAQAVKAALAAQGPGRFSVATPDGTVVIEHAQVVNDGGQDVVELTTADPVGGDPHFRVINPPRYVPDPEGDIVLDGVRFREDPIAALAHVVALHGGRLKDPRRGR